MNYTFHSGICCVAQTSSGAAAAAEGMVTYLVRLHVPILAETVVPAKCRVRIKARRTVYITGRNAAAQRGFHPCRNSSTECSRPDCMPDRAYSIGLFVF